LNEILHELDFVRRETSASTVRPLPRVSTAAVTGPGRIFVVDVER
jgi:hypothetical protein